LTQQSALEQEIYALMGDYLDRYYTPGIAVAAYQDGTPPILLGRGLAVIETGTDVTTQTVFELGSITKVFTATLLALNPGALKECVIKHLPAKVTNKALEQITLVELATHTSGFPEDVPAKMGGEGGDGAIYLFQDQAPPSNSALVSFWNKWDPTDYPNDCSTCPVGSCWQYSNVGFVTLGYAAAGTHYNSLLADRITGSKGLNMPATGAIIPANFPKAQGYVDKDGKPVPAKGEAADLKSNAEDMYTWLTAQISQRGPLQAAILDTQDVFFRASQQCTGNKRPTVYDMGLAWQMRPLNNSPQSQQLYVKDGASGLGGQSCWMGFVSNPNAGVVVLTNGVGAQQPPSYLGLQILGKLLGQSIDVALQE
jgi:beta-lactamase class C